MSTLTETPFLLLNDATTRRACALALAAKGYKVKSVAEKTYAVTSAAGAAYTVEFSKSESGGKLGRCSCPAYCVCKHLAMAVGLHIELMRRRESYSAIVTRLRRELEGGTTAARFREIRRERLAAEHREARMRRAQGEPAGVFTDEAYSENTPMLHIENTADCPRVGAVMI